MSHFTVIIAGENPEELLTPFDENLEYRDDTGIEVPESEMESFVKHYQNKSPIGTPTKELYEIHGDDWNGNEWKLEDNKWMYYSSYNPNSKWDWYSLGGRWTGYFKLKENSTGEVGRPGVMGFPSPKGYVDSCKVSDIDFEGMRDDAETSADKVYDAAQTIIGDLKIEYTWERLLDKKRNQEITIEEARDMYNSQEIVKVFKEKSITDEMRKFFDYLVKVEEYLIPREEYLVSARNSALSSFAYLDEDGWVESGSMGWFGVSSDGMTSREWNKAINDKLDSLDPDTIVSAYDLHI